MNVAGIRRGLAAVLDQIPGCRVVDGLPESLPASGQTYLVITPGQPYVTYSEGSGRVNQNEIRMTVVAVPPQQSGASRVLDELDALLSCGTAAPRSIRTLLGDFLSLEGTACSVSTQSASIRQMTINDMTSVVAEVELLIMARC